MVEPDRGTTTRMSLNTWSEGLPSISSPQPWRCISQEVEQVRPLRLANEQKLALVPSGDAPGYRRRRCGANARIVVSLTTMIRSSSQWSSTVPLVCQPGVDYAQLQDSCARAGAVYPVDGLCIRRASTIIAAISGNLRQGASRSSLRHDPPHWCW